MRDPVAEGLAAGWSATDASRLAADVEIEADVAIVGTGAGGGVSAEILSAAGLSVVLLEEGPLRGSHDFRMREADAYPDLYQESAARKTRDKAINILQGRCVGGSTTVELDQQLPHAPGDAGLLARAPRADGADAGGTRPLVRDDGTAARHPRLGRGAQ